MRKLKIQNSKLLALAVGALTFTLPVAAQAGTVGTTTADILKINQGARPSGMGGAYTAIADDGYSVNYNPAGLAQVKAPQAILLHSDHLALIAYEYFTFVTPWKRRQTLAMNITYRHMPPIDNENGDPPVQASDFLFGLSYARNFKDKFRAGISVKYLKTTLHTFTSAAYMADLGFQIDNLPFGLKAGATVQNLGTAMDFVKNNDATDPLPMFLRFGLGWRKMIQGKKELNLAGGVFKPSDQPLKASLGAEFWMFPELFAVRAGVKREGITKDPGNLFHNYTLGFSLTRRFDDNDFTLDFAFNPAAFTLTVEDTYYAAIKIRFNRLRLL